MKQGMLRMNCRDWNETIPSCTQIQAIKTVENGKIIYFPLLKFLILPHESRFLSSSIAHPKSKNVSFNCHNLKLSGIKCSKYDELEHLKTMIQRFQQNTYSLIQHIFPFYMNALEIGRTSFRPVEITSRIPASYRKDDTRLHVDAFPSSPNQGKRILRVFTNINPYGKKRHWRIGESFEEVAKRFLPSVRRPWLGRGTILKSLKLTRSYSTEYDYIMVQLHNHMKKDLEYQKRVEQNHIHFPAGTTWIVQTDQVSHAAMAGQYVLEQTFYLPVDAMLSPALSPLKILERLLGRTLI